MTRDELDCVSSKGAAFFDRIQLWLDQRTGERLKEISHVRRISHFERYDPKIDGKCGMFEVSSEYWRVDIETEDGTKKAIEVHNNMFGPGLKPRLSIFTPLDIGRALEGWGWRRPLPGFIHLSGGGLKRRGET